MINPSAGDMNSAPNGERWFSSLYSKLPLTEVEHRSFGHKVSAGSKISMFANPSNT